jgi:hypothetical protein
MNGASPSDERRNTGGRPSSFTASSKIPDAFVGDWNESGYCDSDFTSESSLSITAQYITFYEFSCRPEQVHVTGRRLTCTAVCEGEGNTWRENLTFELITDDLLADIESDGSRFNRVRCAPAPTVAGDTDHDSRARSATPSSGVVYIPARRYRQGAKGMRLLAERPRRGDWLPRSGVGARADALASRARCSGDGTADTRRWSAGHTLPRWSVGARRAPGPGCNCSR